MRPMDASSYFRGKRVTVMGLGLLGGVGDIKFLAENGADIIATDLKSEAELAPSLAVLKDFPNIRYTLGRHELSDFRDRDLVIKVQGIDDPLLYRARCCNPIPGQPIIGYVTRGKGVAVHARVCPNVQNLLYESDRRIQVEWGAEPGTNGTPKTTYPVKLTIFCEDRAGMLKEFTAIIADDGTNIRSVDSKPASDGSFVVDFVVETVDMRHLTKLTQNLRKVPGVRDVQRIQKV